MELSEQIELATQYRHKRNWQKARELVSKLTRSHPDQPSVHKEAAELAVAEERWNDAITIYRHIGSTFGESSGQSHEIKLARALRSANRHEEAAIHIRDLLRRTPDDTRAVNELCQLAVATDTTEFAVSYFREIFPAAQNISEELLSNTIRFGYFSWPLSIAKHIRGKKILDVGCGSGVHALPFVVLGAESYTGLDPLIDFEARTAKHKRKRRWIDFGFNANDIIRNVPNVSLIRGDFETMSSDDTFDLITLHYTTEHLHNISTVFQGINHKLSDDGILIFKHHNFFAWNGHHMQPKLITDIDESSKSQKKYIDWKHLYKAHRNDDEVSAKVNKISPSDLKSLTNQYFRIKKWDHIPSKPIEGVNRLSSKILEKFPIYSRSDLITQTIFCIAKKRSLNE